MTDDNYYSGYRDGYAAGLVAGEHQRMHALVDTMHRVNEDLLQHVVDARINALLQEHGVLPKGKQKLDDFMHELEATDHVSAEGKKAFAETLETQLHKLLDDHFAKKDSA